MTTTMTELDHVEPAILRSTRNDPPSPPFQNLSTSRTVAIISCVTCITGISNLLAGLLTVCIPTIARDLEIPSGQELWPASAFGLACGCTLLLCASLSDLLGHRSICLVGSLLQIASSLGAGLTQTPTQLIALRTVAGLAASLCLPSAVGIISQAFPETHAPRSRAVGFSAMGGGQAVGFGLGLALGGIFSDTVGWRWGLHATAGLNGLVMGLAWYALPQDAQRPTPVFSRDTLTRLQKELDWCGALLISTSLALLSYVLAIVSGPTGSHDIRQPLNITLLVLGVTLLPATGFWMRHRTRKDRPALIPNELWSSTPFTSVCITVFLVWGSLNASEQLAALYLQDIRNFSARTTSLYFLPAPIAGIMMNVVVAMILPYLRPSLAVPAACCVSGLAPLLLALLCRTSGRSYWDGIFQAIAMNPIGADIMYTIAMLVVTAAFPTKMQALAGGVFNMLAQIGKSVGIASTAMIAQQVASTHQATDGVVSPDNLLLGYSAGWYYNCGMSFVSVVVSVWGLRSVGKLGIKRE